MYKRATKNFPKTQAPKTLVNNTRKKPEEFRIDSGVIVG